MRFTFLAPSADLSGGARVIHIHAAALRARGHDVTVIVRPPRPRPPLERLSRWRNGEGWRIARNPPSHYRGDAYRLIVLDHYRPITAADVPPSDAIIATWWETAEWMLNFPPSLGTKVHFVQHYEAFNPEFRPRVDAVLRAPSNKITISAWLLEKLRDEFRNVDVAVVPNGVDMNQFDAPVRGRGDPFTVGMLYSTIPFKNTKLGLAIVERLRVRIGPVSLVTFGLTAERRSLPLPANTFHTVKPAQSHIRELYARCDVWLCSSQAEGFHLPPLEAMACRCPVVSTPVGGPLDLIQARKNGYIYPFGDADAAVEQLAEIAALDDAGWRRLSDGAYESALASKWEVASNRFEQALLNAVARNSVLERN